MMKHLKHFAKSIAINEDQSKISELTKSISEELAGLERHGAVVKSINIVSSNNYDPQTTAVVYYETNDDDEHEDVRIAKIEVSASSSTDALAAASKNLQEWLEKNPSIDILDLQTSLYIGSQGEDIVLMHILY